MEKEKIIRKLKMNDYNERLEEIIAKKTFSKDIKNLLSSMLYKIENSYEDYKKIKVNVPSKKETLEELIEIIQIDCKEIEIIKPKIEEENKILKGKKSIAIREEQKIITYQNELALLEAIYEMDTNKFNEESENLEERAIYAVLNEGEKISKSEIIRDFDGWSWNIMTKEVNNYISNIVYQSLVYIIGYNELSQNKNISLEDIGLMLKEKYKSSLTEKILKTVSQLAILNYIKQNPEEYEVLKQIEKQMQEELAKMEDKKAYIEEVTNQKKKYIKEIEEIDKYINDDLALKKEYIKQNEKLPQSERVFSLSDFSEKIEEKRAWLENETKILTEKLKPKNYVKGKTKIEKKLNFIKELNIEEPSKLIYEFINLILKAINMQIEKIETKKEVIEKMYIIRYLKLINVDNEKTIGMLCKKQFEKIEINLITIGCNLKVLNIFSRDVAENYKIYKNIFNTRIIDLESVYIEINKENTVLIYDENSIETKEQFEEIKDITIKHNKKIKIFV